MPYLRQLFRNVTAGEAEEALTPEEYERRRAAYIRAGKGTPPGATPLPPEEVG